MKNVLLTTLLFILTLPLWGGVNLKNGNFYISYTDIIVPGGGADLEILRTFNSKSTEMGWFGFGWGSDFETFLTVSPDGSVVVHENGAGALTRFVPTQAVNPVAAAEKIVEEMRKKGPVDKGVAADLVKKMAADAELRDLYAQKLNVSAKLADGTKLYATVRGLQEMTKTPTGFTRSFNEGKTEFYNNEGKLVKITEKNGYSVELQYSEGRLTSIKDSQAKQLFFAWYPDGKVKNIWSAGDKKTAYEYKDKDLVKSVDVGGNVYEYTYDSSHNMTSVKYGDGTSMKITYTPKTQFVSSILSKDGELTKYIYGANPKNPDFNYWTEVVKVDPETKKETKDKYEYEIRSTASGDRYSYRIATTLNGISSETIYNERGLPLKIVKGTAVTNFTYDTDGLLVSKKSNLGDDIKLEYDKKVKKINRVVTKDGWTNFQYNEKGNLVKADNSQGKSVVLMYDFKGQISKMVDMDKSSAKKVLTFKYNALGKPVEISMEKVGMITVSYDNYGEIKKVDSAAGHKMALQVTQAFQSLLSIVRPAGVSLGL